jgi:magnesium transporter
VSDSAFTRRPLPRTLVGSGAEQPGPAVASGVESIVDCALYREGARQGGVLPLNLALTLAHHAGAEQTDHSSSFVWIALHEPSEEEFDIVARAFALHPLAVEDAVHAHQRPKMETFGDTLFAVLKTVHYLEAGKEIEVGDVMLFVNPHFVVTVRHGHVDPLLDVRRDLEARPELLRAGPGAVLYAIADRIVDDYALAIGRIAEDIEEIEEQVFTGEGENHAERIYLLKREVLAFRRAVAPLAPPMDRLARQELAAVNPRTAPYFRDVHDHLLRVAEQIDGFSELLNGILDANTAGVSMRQNEDMRRITAWVAIVAWATLIAGIYGMNFAFMPELGWRLGYPMALAIMAVGGLWLYIAFRRNRWL